jgi:hypothetical protein
MDFVPERPGFEVAAQVVAEKGLEEGEGLVPLLGGEAEAGEFVPGQVLGQAQEFPGAGGEEEQRPGGLGPAGAAEDAAPGEAEVEGRGGFGAADAAVAEAGPIAPQAQEVEQEGGEEGIGGGALLQEV